MREPTPIPIFVSETDRTFTLGKHAGTPVNVPQTGAAVRKLTDTRLQLVESKGPQSGILELHAADDFMAHGRSLEKLRKAYSCRRQRALELVLANVILEIRQGRGRKAAA